jgi:hypothetical protein
VQAPVVVPHPRLNMDQVSKEFESAIGDAQV